MTHLTDDQLNEYLDGALEPDSRLSMDLHLQTCDSCHLRLAELQAVFAGLAELPEVPLSSDLRDSVLARLPRPRQRLLTPAFAAQCGLALGIFVWLSTEIAKAIKPAMILSRLPQFSFPRVNFVLPTIDVQSLTLASIIALPHWEDTLHSLVSTPYSLFSSPHSLFSIFYFPFSIPHSLSSILHSLLSTLHSPISFSGASIAFAGFMVSLLWLLSNAALLCRDTGARK